MSASLLKLARENSSVVAVVGKGHLQGIKRNWEQPITVRGYFVKLYLVVHYSLCQILCHMHLNPKPQ